MKYREILPDRSLQNLIKCYWTLDMHKPEPHELVNKIIPKGLFELVINYETDYFDITNIKILLPKAFINVPFNKHRIFQTTGDIGIFAIDFTPFGWYQLTRYNGQEFTDKIVSAYLLSPALKELSNRLLESVSNEERVRISNKFLMQLFRKTDNIYTPIQKIISEIDSLNGKINIHKLSCKYFISVSKFERHFKRITGLTPKKYAKLKRFRITLKEGLFKPWQDFVYDLGFYDQAHFIKEFKSFIGESPNKYFQSRFSSNIPQPDKRSFY